MFGLGPSDRLQDISLLWAREIHDNFTVVCSEAKGRVIFCLDRGGSFVNFAQAENVIDGRS